jgi:LacI family transcriptional regulator
MKKRVLLKDIAEKVGVSTSLVSYVLNHQLEDRISKKTAEKIRRTAAELNYQPNQIAKSLKSNKTQTIGLIVADISNPFSSSIARIIEDEAKKHGYTVIFGSADESTKKSSNLIEVLLSRQVDGFIIAPPAGFEKQLIALQNQDVPFVLIDRYFPGLNMNYVVIDNFDTSFNAVTHLIKNGYQHIGMLNYTSKLPHLQDRSKGYWEALKKAGRKKDRSSYVEINEAKIKTEVPSAIEKLLHKKNPIDALFFSTNNLAIEGLSFIRKAGIKVPGDLAVICFDQTNAYDLFASSITYIQQPLLEMGQNAVQLLLASMDDRDLVKETVLRSKLIKHNSSKRRA